MTIECPLNDTRKLNDSEAKCLCNRHHIGKGAVGDCLPVGGDKGYLTLFCFDGEGSGHHVGTVNKDMVTSDLKKVRHNISIFLDYRF
jgi:hypothetical protein